MPSNGLGMYVRLSIVHHLPKVLEERFIHVTMVRLCHSKAWMCIILHPYLDYSTASLRFEGRCGTVHLMAAFCRLESAVRVSEVHKEHVWHYNLQLPDVCMHHVALLQKEATKASRYVARASRVLVARKHCCLGAFLMSCMSPVTPTSGKVAGAGKKTEVLLIENTDKRNDFECATRRHQRKHELWLAPTCNKQ